MMARRLEWLRGWLNRRATAAGIALMALVCLGWQVCAAVIIGRARGITWGTILHRWDAGWYLDIAGNGYSGCSWAFFPLYPLVVRGGARLTDMPVEYCGLAVSVVCCAAALAVYLYATTAGGTANGGESRFPRGNNLGWILFLFSPAAWVFFHPHTESLYLLIMCATLLFWTRRQWHFAALMAGLAALTKNQGAFLALATGLAACLDWWSRGRGAARAMTIFAVCGVISGALCALYPIYQYRTAGDPFLFMHSQLEWRPEMTLSSYLRTLWFGNPWQNMNVGSLIHQVFFFLLVWCVLRLAIESPRNLVWVYFALHVGVMPLSGELVSDLRYAAVLLPLWLMMGLWLGRVKPLALSLFAVALTLALHQFLLRNAIIGRWAY
jgi:hypothetical protein